MKSLLLVFVIVFGGVMNCLAQKENINFSKVRLNGLEFISTKTQVIEKLGQPIKTFEPNYECGFHSSLEQEKPYYELQYDKLTFIGNPEEGYQIDRVLFDAKQNFSMTYGQEKLTHKTTLKEFHRIFGGPVNFDKSKTGEERVFVQAEDDGAMFIFKAGRLVEFHYWSPC